MALKNQHPVNRPARALPRRTFNHPDDHPDLPMDPPLPKRSVKVVDPPTLCRRMTASTVTQQPPDGYLLGHVDIQCVYRVPDTDAQFATEGMDYLMRQLCEVDLGVWLGCHQPPEEDTRHYRLRFPNARRARLFAIHVEAITKARIASIYATYNLISGG